MPEHPRVSIDEEELQQMAADAETARRTSCTNTHVAALEAENARLRADLRHARIEANYWLALYDLADENTATRSYYDALWEDEEHPLVAGDGWESGQPVPGVADA